MQTNSKLKLVSCLSACLVALNVQAANTFFQTNKANLLNEKEVTKND